MDFDVVGTTRGARVRTLLLYSSVLALMFGAQPALAQNSGATSTGTEPSHHVHPIHHSHHHATAAARTATPAHQETEANQPGANQPGTAGQSTPAPSGTAGPTAANPAGTGTAAPAKTEPPPAANPTPAKTEAPPAANPTPANKEASGTTNTPGSTAGAASGNAGAPTAATPPPAPTPPPPKAPLDAAVAEHFVGQSIFGSKGEEIGDLSKLETGPDGKVKSAVITWGGLFGYFQSSRTIDWAPADPVVKDGKLVLNAMTKDEVRNGEKPQASR